VTSSPLLVFDFDGVLVDGMEEYWWAARRACLALAPALVLPEPVPAAFARLRPWIHKGWEMVLLAAELSLGAEAETVAGAVDAAGYDARLAAALGRWGWSAAELQRALEQVRSVAIAQDRDAWLARHRFFPGVLERLRALADEGAGWSVLTTKGGAFAEELLAAAGLQPLAVYGHEQGSKPEVLLRLRAAGRPLWFLEDRRPTLELVRRSAGLEAVRCYLVAWGYLAPDDRQGLEPLGIRWLEPEAFRAPLAEWP
jgi:phosphoglycolate phosphatase-like HAD superfamily hydrolase